MLLFDSHCHLDFPQFDADREAVLAASRAAGLAGILVPGVSAVTWPRLLAVTAAHPDYLHAALGLQPLFLAEHADAHLRGLEQAIAAQRPVAVGEIGLDFQVRELDRGRQRRLFAAQLAIARTAGLPVILHVRKAHEDVLKLLKEAGLRGGVAHAFNGSPEQAQRYADLGFLFGVGGAMTDPRATRLRRTVAALPLEAIVLETDAPDMSPVAHRGERNSPAYLPEVLQALAELREESPETVARAAHDNTRRLFGI